MSSVKREWDAWSFPTLLLWGVFMGVGLVPDTAYAYLREASGVVTQRAIVNSPMVFPVAMVAYIGLFVYRRCIEAGLSSAEAVARQIQISLIALVAFIPFPLTLLTEFSELPHGTHRVVVVSAGVAKALGWLYLMGLFVRGYALGRMDAFAGIYSLFPSGQPPKTRQDGDDPASSTPPEKH